MSSHRLALCEVPTKERTVSHLVAELVEGTVLFQRQAMCAIGRAQSQKHFDFLRRLNRELLCLVFLGGNGDSR